MATSGDAGVPGVLRPRGRKAGVRLASAGVFGEADAADELPLDRASNFAGSLPSASPFGASAAAATREQRVSRSGAALVRLAKWKRGGVAPLR